MVKSVDISGKRFGKLIAIRFDHKEKKYKNISFQYWLFKCDCGNQVVLPKRGVMSGNTKSCGCIHHEMLVKRNKKHLLSKTRLYVVYAGMKARCYDKNHISYKNYGGRGINVCKEWKEDFVSFYNWAISMGYNEKCKRGDFTIDRIDVNGDYCPENCRIVSQKQQNRNNRNNKKITLNGETHCIGEWAEILGLNSATIRKRIERGWSVGKALTTQVF